MQPINAVPDLITPTNRFAEAFDEWRQSRAEYSALCRAVRTGATPGELRQRAAEAGLTNNELADLVQLRARAVIDAPVAAGFAAAARELARLDAEVAKAEQSLDAAEHSAQAEASDKLAWAIELQRRHSMGTYLPAKHAQNIVAVAKERGVF